jgi:hypothetical protein
MHVGETRMASRDDRIVARRSILGLAATLASTAAIPLVILAREARAAGFQTVSGASKIRKAVLTADAKNSIQTAGGIEPS